MLIAYSSSTAARARIQQKRYDRNLGRLRIDDKIRQLNIYIPTVFDGKHNISSKKK